VTNDDSSSNSKDDWSHTEAISMPDRALPGIQNLKHTVVLMMENRFLDHMLGALHGQYPAIDGLAGSETTRT
jgi:phospholipase C